MSVSTDAHLLKTEREIKDALWDSAASSGLEGVPTEQAKLIIRWFARRESPLREVATASTALCEALLRGSPGWLETPAGKELVRALAELER